MILTGGDFQGRQTDGPHWPLYFLAANNKDHVLLANPGEGKLPIHPYLLIAINEFGQDHVPTLIESAKAGVKTFIDSGVFHLTNEHSRKHDVSMDTALSLAPEEIDGFAELFAKYVGLMQVLGPHVWGYIEIDQGGRENKIKTRAKLEKLGLVPIPVYHPFNDGWDYFDYLAERYDRICFGNVVQADAMTRRRLIATAWERKRKYPHLWIHLLGYTPNEHLNAYPIDSADSSSWLTMIRWSAKARSKSMLKVASPHPVNLRYKLGSTEGLNKARRLAAYEFRMDLHNWRNHLRALESEGVDLLPPVTP